MYENVVIGVDGLAGGRDAITLALRLARGATRVTLAHVRSPSTRRSSRIRWRPS